MPGKLVHVEIGAENADRAQGFWSGVFGWEIGPPMSPEMD
jgi:predicted enzyme related to lactoylglutathione lyase